MRISILILLGFHFLAQPMTAQNGDFPNAVHAKLNLLDYGMLYNSDLRLSQGFEFAYFRNINRYLNIGVPGKVGLAKLPLSADNMLTAMGDLQVQIGDHRSSAKFSPYLMGGAGIFAEQGEGFSPMFPFGAGVHFRISKFAFINVQGEFRKSMRDNRDNIQLGAGYVYLLHKSEAEPEIPQPLDTDMDSIPDMIDLCPELAGPASALGCPDSDGDGVGDHEDRCPDFPGVLEAEGCPDSDLDGVADGEDRCPDTYGTINGCPDSDGDGFSDNEDDCPTEAGRWNGCPDSDFDGVADKDDKCPDDPGSIEFDGCPDSIVDSDGDGFTDNKDGCPNESGPVNGCPDKDNDGVADKDDPCPNDGGTLNGCPDLDGDGIADKDDPCPRAKGEFNGCPDSDGDSVPDNLDKCPNSQGTVANNGCPEIKQEVRERLSFAMKAVQFETGSATLKTESYAVLDEIHGFMKEYPDTKLTISGHTDNVGDEGRNLTLSTDRAKACYDYFIFRGMSSSRLRFMGFGESRPMAENTTAEGRELNRRVEFVLGYE